MRRIKAIGWDVDNVWYGGTSSSYCANSSKSDPSPHIERFVGEGLFTHDDIDDWGRYSGKGEDPIESVGDLARCLTDFFYVLKRPEGNPVLTKKQVIKGKQSLLRGLTMTDVRGTADAVQLTTGFREAVHEFNENKVYQSAFSDGFGPFILYMAKKEGIEYCVAAPVLVTCDGEEVLFDSSMLDIDAIVFTGKVGEFDKGEAFFEHIEEKGYHLENVAVIDDSSANIETLKKVRDLGGISIAFDPNEGHEKEFREVGIPILKERDLRLFMEIVLDPARSKIGRYCV